MSAKLFWWSVLLVEAAAVIWLRQPWLVIDSEIYVLMSQGDWSWGSFRTPGYPLFLAALAALGLSPAGVVIIQMALYLVSIWLIDHFVAPKSAPFLPLCVLYIFPLFYVAAIATEAITIFCVASALALVMGRSSLFAIFSAGMVLGFATLVRPDHLPAVLALPAVVLFFSKAGTWDIKGAGLAVAGALTFILPYAAWNATHFGRFSPFPVDSTIGQSLYMASWENEASFDDLQLIAAGAPPTQSATRIGLVRELEQIRKRGGTSDDFRDAALARMSADLPGTAWHAMKGIWRLQNTGRYPAPPLIALGISVVSNAIWLLGVLGILAFARGQLLVPAIIYLSILVSHLPLHTEARYTASIRLILVLFASIMLAAIWGFLRDRRKAFRWTAQGCTNDS